MGEDRIAALADFEASGQFSAREKVALRYTDAIMWNPQAADDAMWADLHQHFTEPELVELGYFIGFTSGGQRWIQTLQVEHGEVPADSATGLKQNR